MNTAHFTDDVATMVARNDRYAWLRGLRVALRRASRRVVIMWCSAALAAGVIYMVPPYTRFYS